MTGQATGLGEGGLFTCAFCHHVRSYTSGVNDGPYSVRKRKLLMQKENGVS